MGLISLIGWGGIACLASLVTGEAWVFKRLLKSYASKHKKVLTIGLGANKVTL